MEVPQDTWNIATSFDIRVEVLAATLLSRKDVKKQQIGIEQIVIAPQGDQRRRSSHEVKRVRSKTYEDETVFFIEINRKGFFDTLPEGLFLDSDVDYANAQERTKGIAEEVKAARKFLLPFEQSLYLPGIVMEQIEQKWTENFPAFIEQIWGLPAHADYLDSRQRFLLCYLLPEAYRIAGDWELTGLCFEAVLRKPVDIQLSAPQQYQIPEVLRANSECSIGEEVVLGDDFRGDMPTLEISIKGITVVELPEFLKGGKSNRLLEKVLCSYFLPLDVPAIVKIEPTESAWGFDLGVAFLGYNVQLQAMEYLSAPN